MNCTGFLLDVLAVFCGLGMLSIAFWLAERWDDFKRRQELDHERKQRELNKHLRSRDHYND